MSKLHFTPQLKKTMFMRVLTVILSPGKHALNFLVGFGEQVERKPLYFCPAVNGNFAEPPDYRGFAYQHSFKGQDHRGVRRRLCLFAVSQLLVILMPRDVPMHRLLMIPGNARLKIRPRHAWLYNYAPHENIFLAIA